MEGKVWRKKVEKRGGKINSIRLLWHSRLIVVFKRRGAETAKVPAIREFSALKTINNPGHHALYLV